jgi:hypothetical protein
MEGTCTVFGMCSVASGARGDPSSRDVGCDKGVGGCSLRGTEVLDLSGVEASRGASPPACFISKEMNLLFGSTLSLCMRFRAVQRGQGARGSARRVD